jgi:nucleolar protein 56
MNRLEELRKKMLSQTRKQVSIEYGEKELGIIRATNALDDLDASFNLLFEHSREWYHSFFPELERAVADPELFLKLVYEIGNKKDFSGKKLDELVEEKELKGKITKAAESSVGAIEEEKILSEIKLLALNALNLKQERKALESLVEAEMKKQAPNFSELAGALLGARMLAKAGSFQRLATMPSSTIQILGAEKALFRHLKAKRKERPPKYGFLFAHSLVKQLHPSHKGKMARFLAGKLSIALRIDVFGGKRPIAQKLLEQAKTRFEELQKKPAKPKPRYEPERFERKEFREFKPKKFGSPKKFGRFEEKKPAFGAFEQKKFKRKEFGFGNKKFKSKKFFSKFKKKR